MSDNMSLDTVKGHLQISVQSCESLFESACVGDNRCAFDVQKSGCESFGLIAFAVSK
jgi:hypothetical protein